MVTLTKTTQQVLYDDVVDKKVPRAGLKTLLDEVIAAVTALEGANTLTVVSVTGNTDVTAADAGKLFHATATATLSLVAAATAGAEFVFNVLADGFAVTIDPDGSEQVNGATTLVIPAGHYAQVRCTGSAWRAEVWPTTAARDPLIITDQNTTLTAAQNRAKVIGTGAMALTLPEASAAGEGFMITAIGKGGAVTVTRAGTDTIDGANTLVVADGAAALVLCTGSGWTAHVFAGAGGGGGASSLAVIDLTNGGADDLTAAPFTGLPSGIYKIVLALKKANTAGTDNLLVQMSTGGSFVTTGYDSRAATINSTAGFICSRNTNSHKITGLWTFVREPGSNLWVGSVNATRESAADVTGNGHIVLAGALDGIRLTRHDSATFNDGELFGWYWTE